MPQEELAALSGLTRASIANIESVKQRVLLHQLLQFAWALRVEVADLVPRAEELPKVVEPGSEEKKAYIDGLKKLAQPSRRRRQT